MPSFSDIANIIQNWLNETFSPAWSLVFQMLIAGVCVIGLFATLGLILN